MKKQKPTGWEFRWGLSITVIHSDSFYLFPLRYWDKAALLSLAVGWMAESTVLIGQSRLLHAGHKVSRTKATMGINIKGKTKLTKRPTSGWGGRCWAGWLADKHTGVGRTE